MPFRKLSMEIIPDPDKIGKGFGLHDPQLSAFVACWRHGRICQPNCAAFAISYVNLPDRAAVQVVRCRVMEDSNIIGELVLREREPLEGKLIEFPGKDKN